MKVAICFDKGRVFQHFGHTKEFKIYEINDKVEGFYYVSSNGEGCSTLVPILKANHVNVLVCGGLGQGAFNHLTEAGIIVVSGVEGEVDEVIGELIQGTLKHSSEPNCDHHDHDENCHHDDHKCCH